MTKPKQQYLDILKDHPNFITIDPGARAGGGTGIASYIQESNADSTYTIRVSSFLPVEAATTHLQKCDDVIKQIKWWVVVKSPSVLEHDFNCSVFIEEPKYFDTAKGQVAVRSDKFTKLVFIYGRLFQLFSDRFPIVIPLKIADWKGQLSKKQVENRVKKILPESNYKGDEIDAVGMALYLKGLF